MLIRNIYRTIGLGTACAVLGACGGDSGGSGGNPQPATNAPPVFEATTAISVPENEVLVAPVLFSDPEGGKLTYSLTSSTGVEGNFLVDEEGRLLFAEPADFERPAGVGGAELTNEYRFTVSATDPLGATTSRDITVTVTDLTGADDQRYVDEIFGGVGLVENVQFGVAPRPGGRTEDLFMNIYLPPSIDTETRRPVILLAFPGGFIQGDRDDVANLAFRFALRGYVAATVDYRIAEEPPASELDYLKLAADAIQDVSAAVRFFREDGLTDNTYGVDPNLIFVGGESAGAVIAATLATLEIDDLEPGSPIRTYLEETGGIAGRSSDNADTISSDIQGALSISGGVLDLAFIDSGSRPLFVAHHTGDTITPCETGPEGLQNSGVILSGGCAISARYQALGLEFGKLIVQGPGHVNFSPLDTFRIFNGASELFYRDVIAPSISRRVEDETGVVMIK